MSGWSTWLEARAVASRLQGVEVLSSSERDEVADRIVQGFVADANARWWWENLRPDASLERVEYSDGDLWQPLRGLLPSDEPLVLLVTDEEPQHSGGVQGYIDRLEHFEKESEFFFEFARDS